MELYFFYFAAASLFKTEQRYLYYWHTIDN
ncbi:hypothetical protein HNQ56_000551 [Anaerotaenia torta]